ncbi:MAG: helix-hairpin-helix domain-containing protein, partial [Flavobacteriales bacterium]|nr:helix-hairpin-helix domain-containing protein [Flavobacteriales bacterium]
MRARQKILLPILFFCSCCIGQTDQRDILEQSIELIAEVNEDAEVDYTTLIDALTYHLERPLNLNSATRDELLSLEILTEIQVNRILSHRSEYGRFIAIEELQAVAELPWNVIVVLRNFTQVGRGLDDLSITFSEIRKNGEHELFLRSDRIIEQLKGASPISDEELEENPNRRFLGDQWRYYTRYRFRYQNRISIGFTAEKDPGEEFFKGSRKDGFDFYSAHAYAREIGTVDRLAIGDFQVQMGQGLTQWSGLGFGKSANLFTIKRNARGVVPYRSVDENNFLRGAAVTLKRDQFYLTLFGSSKRRDANILTGDTLEPEEVGSFSALQINGFHRTPREIADKNTLGEKIAGAELKWVSDALTIGVRGVALRLDKELDITPSDYNQFFFTGNENHAVGADYDYVKGNLNLFGEITRTANGAIGFVNGGYLVLDPRLTIAALQRNYAKDFQPIYSLPISESSRIANERGLMMGLVARPDVKWTVTAWMDRFSFPWLRFLTDSPSQGFEVLGQVNYRPNKKVEAYFRYRYRQRPRNSSDEELIIDRVGETDQTNYRLNTRFVITEGLSLRSRIELTDFTREGNATTSYGMLMYQDIIFRPKEFPIDLSIRYALF